MAAPFSHCLKLPIYPTVCICLLRMKAKPTPAVIPWMEAGMDDYISKPIDMQQLRATIERVMTR